MRYPQKIGRLGLVLAAMLLIGAISAGAASAAEFAASPNFPVKFKGQGGVGLLETQRGRSVTCTGGKASGAAENSTLATASVVFTGCHAEHLPLLTCNSTGMGSGEIATTKMEGTPVNLDTTKTDVGILLQPASGEVMAEFKCALSPISETLIVKGAVIGKFRRSELNEFRSTLHLEFKAVLGTQEYTQIEGAGPQYFLTTEGKGTEPFAAEQSGITEAEQGSTTLEAEEGKKVKVIP
jgi:hypothetical protein